MGRYPVLLPAIFWFVLVPVLLMIAPALERTGRKLTLVAAVLVLTFWVYGANPGRLGLWMVRHLG
jgi:hypothetical protein